MGLTSKRPARIGQWRIRDADSCGTTSHNKARIGFRRCDCRRPTSPRQPQSPNAHGAQQDPGLAIANPRLQRA